MQRECVKQLCRRREKEKMSSCLCWVQYVMGDVGGLGSDHTVRGRGAIGASEPRLMSARLDGLEGRLLENE